MEASLVPISFQKGEIYDLCEIGESKFAFFHKPIQCRRSSIDLSGHHVVLLADLEVEETMTFKAASVIALGTLKGCFQVHTSGHFVVLNNVELHGSCRIVAGGPALIGADEECREVLKLFWERYAITRGATVGEIFRTFTAIANTSSVKNLFPEGLEFAGCPNWELIAAAEPENRSIEFDTEG